MGSMENWLLTAVAGLILVYGIIRTEGIMINKPSSHISTGLKAINRRILQF